MDQPMLGKTRGGACRTTSAFQAKSFYWPAFFASMNRMNASHRHRLGLPAKHRLVQTDMRETLEGNVPVMTFWYDQVDAAGNFVRQHVVKETITAADRRLSSNPFDY